MKIFYSCQQTWVRSSIPTVRHIRDLRFKSTPLVFLKKLLIKFYLLSNLSHEHSNCTINYSDCRLPYCCGPEQIKISPYPNVPNEKQKITIYLYFFLLLTGIVGIFIGMYHTKIAQLKFLYIGDEGNAGPLYPCPTEGSGICPMICSQGPPYICGSDGKNYCNECIACQRPTVK